jgi:protein ImuB
VSVSGPGGASEELLVGFVSPTDSHPHVLEMLSLRFERAALPDEVLFVRLEAVTTSSLEIRQRDLFGEDSEQHHREVFSLVDRLTNRLGANAVLHSECVPERVPEETVVYQPWLAASEKPRTGSVTACSAWPLRMLRRPEDVQVFRSGSEGAPLSFHWNHHEHRVIRSWGPERIETTWWSESPVLRDYFRVEDQSGRQFWLFRRLDSRRWFIHGTFE